MSRVCRGTGNDLSSHESSGRLGENGRSVPATPRASTARWVPLSRSLLGKFDRHELIADRFDLGVAASPDGLRRQQLRELGLDVRRVLALAPFVHGVGNQLCCLACAQALQSASLLDAGMDRPMLISAAVPEATCVARVVVVAFSNLSRSRKG